MSKFYSQNCPVELFQPLIALVESAEKNNWSSWFKLRPETKNNKLLRVVFLRDTDTVSLMYKHNALTGDWILVRGFVNSVPIKSSSEALGVFNSVQQKTI